MSIKHKDVYEDSEKIATKLPFTNEIREIHENGYFPLITDPLKEKKTSFVGMFVLRPAKEAWTTPVTKDSLKDVKNWTYNIAGLDGGWLIANGNLMDAYRLALQYAISDAVLVGSTTVSKEGTPHNGEKGYIWHPYGPASWPHLAAADPKILQKVMDQRKSFQEKGYLSTRKYPAQIIVTQSGKPSEPDILEASIFHETTPEGEPIEAYILTSHAGAEKIRERASKFGLESRMNDILIPLSSQENPAIMDLSGLPKLLYDKYDIKMANHDGGALVLSEFAKAGILDQMNLTLTRQQSVYDVLNGTNKVEKEKKDEILLDFDQRLSYFFGTLNGKISDGLVPVHILADYLDEAAVVTFDARQLKGKGFR